jgi:succinate dehydrogenase / fumarate reductase cytochrome b subunit
MSCRISNAPRTWELPGWRSLVCVADLDPILLSEPERERIVHHPDRGIGSAAANPIPRQFGGSYRWFTGSLAYVLHRVTGLGLIFFLFFHIISITKANASPEAYDLMIRRMQEPDFKLGELALFAALLFHGINGMRIIWVDFVATRTTHHKTIFWGLIVLVTALFILGAVPLLLHSNVQPLLGDHALPGGN